MTKHDRTRTERYLRERPGQHYTAHMLARRIERSEPCVRRQLQRLLDEASVAQEKKRHLAYYRWIEA